MKYKLKKMTIRFLKLLSQRLYPAAEQKSHEESIHVNIEKSPRGGWIVKADIGSMLGNRKIAKQIKAFDMYRKSTSEQ